VNVLHVNNVDLPGRRFNGYDLMSDLRSRGVEGRQAVLTKHSADPAVFSLCSDPGDEELQSRISAVEQRHSINNILFPWGRLLAESPEFARADVVHYHLIHNRMVSLYELPSLFSRKPSVWTFHDRWPFTGHCIYPKGCERWLEGCGECPSLAAGFPLQEGGTDSMWRLKKRIYADLDVDIVVASDFMLDMARRSPLTSHFEHVHCIPFGIRTEAFLAEAEKAASRHILGIPEDDFVLLCRSTESELKGLRYIVDALRLRPPRRATTVLTVDQRGLVRHLPGGFRVKDMGWIDDPELYPRVLSACDVLVMPSLEEAFGLMAVEAMGAGRPVICFEGTSLPSVSHAPECGIAVPRGDVAALREAIDRLSGDSHEVAVRGEVGRSVVAQHYGHERYLDEMADLYGAMLSRAERGPRGTSI